MELRHVKGGKYVYPVMYPAHHGDTLILQGNGVAQG